MENSKTGKLTRLEKGRLAYQEKVRNGEIVRQNPLERAKSNPNSMRKAIDANCWSCCGEENWINRTKYCHLFDCPFWTMRKGNKRATQADCEAWDGS